MRDKNKFKFSSCEYPTCQFFFVKTLLAALSCFDNFTISSLSVLFQLSIYLFMFQHPLQVWNQIGKALHYNFVLYEVILVFSKYFLRTWIAEKVVNFYKNDAKIYFILIYSSARTCCCCSPFLKRMLCVFLLPLSCFWTAYPNIHSSYFNGNERQCILKPCWVTMASETEI